MKHEQGKYFKVTLVQLRSIVIGRLRSMIIAFFIGSRPESSEGDHPQYQNCNGGVNGALLDPMAISLMPPEFERPNEQRQNALMAVTSSKIEEVQRQLERLMSGSEGNDATVEGFGPKGSLV